ncbi:MAG: efflux RND transporter permease subunit, partial [Candidatus Heimdallarchaeota archaeon]|nr:efflux RND transporter permease subunit [Candidatus Heimdallarchaeota archaeon]
MKLANFSVKNSLLINLLSVFIVLVGFYLMLQMNREAFPSVSYDIVNVTTVYPGAPSEDVEKLVTIPLEKEIKGISGIDYITSSSEEGLSDIGIYIDPRARDKNKVVNDIQSAVDRVNNLPETAGDPSVFELDSREFPVIEISLTGDVGEDIRRKYAETLEGLIEDIEGTASVRRIVWRDRELWVEVDPDKLQDFHISMQEVMDALKVRNVSVPGGQMTTADIEFNVRITGEFTTPEEI